MPRIGTATNRGTQSTLITFKDGKVIVCAVTPPGQSGFVGPNGERSQHYAHQMALYDNFECCPQALLREDVHKVARNRVSFEIKDPRQD